MKKLILILTLLGGFSAVTFAQPETKSPQKRAEHVTKVLQKQLNLSADQATQVNSIMLVQANRMDSLKTNISATDRRLNKLSKRSIMLNTDEDLSFVLNPDQKKAYENWKAVKKEKHMQKVNSAEAMTRNMPVKNEI